MFWAEVQFLLDPGVSEQGWEWVGGGGVEGGQGSIGWLWWMNESQKGLFIVPCCIMFLTMPICVLPLEVRCSQFHCLCPGVDASRDPQHAWNRNLQDPTSSANLIGLEGTCGPWQLWKIRYNLWLSLSSYSQRFACSNLREVFEIIYSFSPTGSENPPQTWGGHWSLQRWVRQIAPAGLEAAIWRESWL